MKSCAALDAGCRIQRAGHFVGIITIETQADNAHAFINFILDAEVGAAIADFIQYATPNAAARRSLSVEYNSNPAIFPSQETIERCEVATYNGPDYTRRVDEAWTRIMAS